MRVDLYSIITNNAPLMAQLPGGVHGSRSLDSVPQSKPFCVLTIGVTTPQIKDNGVTVASFTNATIWVHDDPGDYMRIDEILRDIQVLLEAQVSAGNLIRIDWSEVGEDAIDDVMNTYTRAATVRLVHKV